MRRTGLGRVYLVIVRMTVFTTLTLTILSCRLWPNANHRLRLPVRGGVRGGRARGGWRANAVTKSFWEEAEDGTFLAVVSEGSDSLMWYVQFFGLLGLLVFVLSLMFAMFSTGSVSFLVENGSAFVVSDVAQFRVDSACTHHLVNQEGLIQIWDPSLPPKMMS